MTNETKKQHFVPKFYLKNFSDSTGFINVLDMKNNRLGSPRPYSGVGYSDYFYANETGTPDEISQVIEKWLQVYEDIISKSLPGIIDKIVSYKHIDDDDKYTLSTLICMLWLRSPGMRNQLNKMNEDISKRMMKFYAPERVDSHIKRKKLKITEDERKVFIEALENGSYKLKFNNANHLRFMTKTFGFGGAGFINMFFGQKWTIYIAKGDKKFITSDSPVVEWWLPPKSFYGASFLERNKYFPLTPEILIILTYPLVDCKVKRKTIFNNKNNEISLYNILIAGHSHEFSYSCNKNSLEELINGRIKHGFVENKYYEEYEKPWELYRSRNGGYFN